MGLAVRIGDIIDNYEFQSIDMKRTVERASIKSRLAIRINSRGYFSLS